MTSPEQKHWEDVYARKAADQVSWYRPHLDESLRFLTTTGIGPSAAIIDVGGGASTFVDDLFDRGYFNVTVLDLSASALETAKRRLGDRASAVHWLCADVTRADLPVNALPPWDSALRQESSNRSSASRSSLVRAFCAVHSRRYAALR